MHTNEKNFDGDFDLDVDVVLYDDLENGSVVQKKQTQVRVNHPGAWNDKVGTLVREEDEFVIVDIEGLDDGGVAMFRVIFPKGMIVHEKVID